jgi:hypothetical protein
MKDQRIDACPSHCHLSQIHNGQPFQWWKNHLKVLLIIEQQNQDAYMHKNPSLSLSLLNLKHPTLKTN